VPPQPKSWLPKHVPLTNQTEADGTFWETVGKLQAGLTNRLTTYATSTDPTEQRIYAIWTTGSDAHQLHAFHEELSQIDEELAILGGKMAALREKRQSLVHQGVASQPISGRVVFSE